MIFQEGEYLCFDDVLLVPQYSKIESRKLVDISTSIAGIDLKVPIISANMDTITEDRMALAMWKAGGLGILHRYANDEGILEQIYYLNSSHIPVIPSIGVNEEDIEKAENFAMRRDDGELDISVICVDVAHSHHLKALKMTTFLKGLGFKVISGNIATYEAAKALVDEGADVIKVGIGPGSLCTTRLVTGHGIPQLSAIINVSKIKEGYPVQIIADGGIRCSGDIVKSLAAGADAVMIGRLFAGCEETPGKVFAGKKVYRGSASFSAQVDRDKFICNYVPEGESILVRAKGSVREVVDFLAGGIRSGFSYSGCSTIKELQENAIFVRVSENTNKESNVWYE